MGDRGNVVILDQPGQAVVLYTHSGGRELPMTVQAALAKRWRWDDASYLARIVFDQMTAGQHGAETGFGIYANVLGDNEWNILVLDARCQRIASRAPGMDDAIFAPIAATEGLTFEAFLALSAQDVQAFRDHGEDPRPSGQG